MTRPLPVTPDTPGETTELHLLDLRPPVPAAQGARRARRAARTHGGWLVGLLAAGALCVPYGEAIAQLVATVTR